MTPTLSSSLPLSLRLDLAGVEPTGRRSTWRAWTESVLRGLRCTELTAQEAPRRSISRETVGAGSWWRLEAPSLRVRRRGSEEDALSPFLILLAVTDGHAEVRHAGVLTRLEPGHLYWLDGRLEMDYLSPSSSLVTMHLPRGRVLERHPYCSSLTGRSVDTRTHGGARLLHDTMLGFEPLLPKMAVRQRSSALDAIIDMHGFLSDVAGEPTAPASHWRVARLQQDIAENLGDPTLSADRLSSLQNVSRRHLDAILIKETGVSITGSIWEQRLLAAQALLRADITQGRCSITQIAFETGFQSSAHFSRLFKERTGQAPRDWRAAQLTP